MDQIVGILKLLRWKTKVQTFRKELLFNIGKYILGKVKNDIFGIVFSLAFLQKLVLDQSKNGCYFSTYWILKNDLTSNFRKIIEKCLANSSFLVKFLDLQPATLLKTEILHMHVSKILPTSQEQLFQFISSQYSTYKETRQSTFTCKMPEKLGSKKDTLNK